jgi:anti-sigma factor RsiW
MPRTDYPTLEELSAFHRGELPEPALRALAAHLESCPTCEAAARALDEVSDSVVSAYRHSALSGPAPALCSVRAKYPTGSNPVFSASPGAAIQR